MKTRDVHHIYWLIDIHILESKLIQLERWLQQEDCRKSWERLEIQPVKPSEMSRYDQMWCMSKILIHDILSGGWIQSAGVAGAACTWQGAIQQGEVT